jgi:DNA-binding NarL/FixJ family response regulator
VVDESARIPTVRPQPELVGRDAERAEVDRFLARVRSGARALVIHGDPGIGKTAMWRYGIVAARDEGCFVLSTRPAEEEMPFALAGLVDLFEERDLAAAALAPDTGQLARGRAVLDALRGLAAQAPVVLAIDDLQWLDITSARTLRYALRRLDEEPVGVLATARTGSDTESPLDLRSTLPPGRSDPLELGPLSLEALRRVVAGIVDTISRPTLRNIHEVSGGNPLYAIELARALAADRETRSVGVRLPDSLQSAIDQRLDAAPAELLPLLERVSGLGSAPFGVLEAAMPGTDVPALVALAQRWQMLVVEEDLEVRFVHPLLASAVYGRMDALARRSLHAELAAAATHDEARVRHLALSTDEPDAGIAAALEEAALRASGRGAPDVAAELARHSVRLTPPAEADAGLHRALLEIEWRVAAGESGRAATLAQDLVGSLSPGRARAEAIVLSVDVGDVLDDESPLLMQALEESEGDDHLRCRALRMLADVRANEGDVLAGIDFGRQAYELAAGAGDPQLELLAATVLGHLETQAGMPRAELMARAVELEDELGMPIVTQGPRELLVKHCLWAGDLPGARALLADTRAAAVRSGLAAKEMQHFYDLSLVECSAGNLGEAEHAVDRAVEAALDADDMWSERLLLYARSLIDAWLGRADEARSAAKRLVDETGSLGMDKAVPRGLSVLGLLALSEGDAEGAARDLAEAARRREEMGIRHPGAEPELADAVEALAFAGELEAASDLLVRLRHQADAVDSPWPLAATARARGAMLLAKGDPAEAARLLTGAAADFERLGFRPDAARARLLEGRAILRDGRRSQAAEVLATARDLFAAIGAPLWEARAVEELERVSPGRASGDLTPTEGRIAALVAEGLKNREIAERLFLSVATVEAHLTRIYRKLGIRSRSDLTRLVVDDEISFPAGS